MTADSRPPRAELPWRILVADDAEVNRDLLIAMLAPLPARFEAAAGGAEVLERVRGQRFDLIFIDLRMPGMDGFETVRRVRTMPHGRGVPIVAVTGDAFSVERHCFADAGFDDVLHKPIRPDTLLRMANRWLCRPPAPP